MTPCQVDQDIPWLRKNWLNKLKCGKHPVSLIQASKLGAIWKKQEKIYM